MKVYKNLFKQISSHENVCTAYHNAIKGKKRYKEVIEIEKDREKFLEEIAKELQEKTYKVSPYDIFKMMSGGKEREIYRLPMKDRVVQHAMMMYCESIFRESFIVDTFQSIKGRGIHRGLQRLKRALNDIEYKYVLQLDIHHCYPSIDQGILKQKLFKKFLDPDLLWLLTTIIDSCDKGVPIGNYTSQYFNNFYFSDFDHWIKEQKRIKYYFRYCDDMVIFGKTKEELHKLLKEIKEYMSTLRVEIKPNYRIYPVDKGVNFLGYISTKDHIRIRKSTKKNFIRKVKKMDFNNLTPRDINVLGSYWGILKRADCRRLWLKYTGRVDFYHKKMADIEKFIPILIRWEAGTLVKHNETLENAFLRAKKVGFVNDPHDNGGATMVGVTIGTYRAYCKYKGKKVPTVTDLKNISYKEWRDVVHTMYWSKWKADLIKDQNIANMIVDWVWTSGQGIGIKRVQKLLGVTADGIVGPKTIAAINAQDSKVFLKKVYDARAAHFNAIVKANPTQKKWLNGWMNRINYIYNLYK